MSVRSDSECVVGAELHKDTLTACVITTTNRERGRLHAAISLYVP